MLHIVPSEGSLASQKLEQEDAAPPEVDLLVVLVAISDLRGQVVCGPAEGQPLLIVLREGSPPEVAQFNAVKLVVKEEDVLRLEVSVDDVPVPHVDKRINDLPKDLLNLAFPESLAFGLLDPVKEVALFGCLHDHVDVPLVVEVAVEPCDVGMPESVLDLNLAPGLVQVAVFLNLANLYDFEGNLLARDLFSGHLDSAKLALAKFSLCEFKVVD